MPAAKKAPPAAVPDRFFVKQLKGEEPPTRATLRTLWQQASWLLSRQPWSFMGDRELVIVKDPATGEYCYCNIMGAMGEVYSLHVFLGDAGYKTYKSITSGPQESATPVLAIARSVYVEWVPLAEMNPPDKELARALKTVPGKTTRSLIFRSMRPGFHPWYITEQEAQTLTHCANAVLAVTDLVAEDPAIDLWPKPGNYPLMEPKGDSFELAGQVPPQNLHAKPQALPLADHARIEKIRKRRYPAGPPLELGTIYAHGSIGKKDERKAILLLALAIDATTAAAYPPGVGRPGQPQADMLADVLFSAIEAGGTIPAEVHVREGDHKPLFEILARELGFKLKIRKALPAFDFAKENILEMMLGGQP